MGREKNIFTPSACLNGLASFSSVVIFVDVGFQLLRALNVSSSVRRFCAVSTCEPLRNGQNENKAIKAIKIRI